MSYILKIGDKEIGKVDSIRTPEPNEMHKTSMTWGGNDQRFQMSHIMQEIYDNARLHYTFAFLNPEE
jgi:hypothetical protein